MSTARPLSSLLSRSTLLLEHTRQLVRLQKQLDNVLPSELSRHCRVQNLRGETLCLQADSSVWANRLRYILPSLRQQLRASGVPLRDIQVAVVPAQTAPTPAKRHAQLSTSAAQLLQESAAAMDDPQLREALLRLAKNAKHR